MEGGDLRTQPRWARARLASLVTAAIALAMAATVILPAPAEASTSHVMESMPNFVGMGRSAVFSEMYSAHLYFKTQGRGANTTRWVRVIGEIPAAGTAVPAFSTVILEVTTGTEVTSVRHVVKKPVIKVVSIIKRNTKSSKPSKKKRHAKDVDVDFRVGVATWYSYIPGQCATWYLPRGTRVTVEDLRNGHTISCVVTDREETRGDRAVDLSETQFAELAPLAVGVVPVRVTW